MFFREPSEQDKKIAYQFAEKKLGDYLPSNQHSNTVERNELLKEANDYTKEFESEINTALEAMDERAFVNDNEYLIFEADYYDFRRATRGQPRDYAGANDEFDYEKYCSSEALDKPETRIKFLKYIAEQKQKGLILYVKW